MHKLKQLIVFLALISPLAISGLVSAQQSQPGSGLSIEPLHSSFNLAAGEKSTLTITVKNTTSGPIIAKPKINDFKSDNNTGNPIIITDPNKKLNTSIKDFVSGLSDIPLNKGEQKNISVAIEIPTGQTPGAYYGIIRYQAVPTNNGQPAPGDVSLSASVGTIVLIQVKGNLIQRIQLQDIKIYNGKVEGTFFTAQPSQIGILINNFGNSFVQPFGRVTITKWGGKSVYSYEFNNSDPRGTILPGSNRLFKNPLKNISSPGRYTVNASIAYGSGSDILILQKNFWYIPIWLMAVIVLIIVFLIIATIALFRRRRHSRRRNKKLSR
jgi:hypothetical protein